MEKTPSHLKVITENIHQKVSLSLDCQNTLESLKAVKRKINKNSPQIANNIAAIEEAAIQRRFDKNQLINKINFVNFQGENVLVAFRHKRFLKTKLVKATPQPCTDENLTCFWEDCRQISEILTSHVYRHIFITDGLNLLHMQAELLQINENCINVRLPDEGYEISSRKFTRHSCKGINASVIQNGAIFKGELIDFNAISFRVYFHSNPSRTFHWFNQDFEVLVIFSNDNETLYSGRCTAIQQTGGQKSRTCVLKPVTNRIQRFKKKEYRSQRHTISPSPLIVFRHPFTGKLISTKTIDLSGSGFSVEEDARSAMLLPGLMIPELNLCFSSHFRFKCKAQLIYRHPFENDESRVKCGVALLDMNTEEHVQLLSLLQNAENKNSYICNKIDQDELWHFFFETGFIYPHKYNYIQKNKHQIKKTYEKLYLQTPNIARHFIYQDKGRILAHMGMVRFYNNTWMIHHHAARKSESNSAGLRVLKQIGDFGNDSHRLCSIKMDYLMCYYRPENKFPRRIFGTAVKRINNLKGCSEDLFAYFHLRVVHNLGISAYSDWELTEIEEEDLNELSHYYKHFSGGLMLDAINLTPDYTNIDRLVEEYRKFGFRRERYVYAIRRKNKLIAIVMLDQSDIGLNLSELTNSIKVIVIDPDKLTKDVLECFLSDAARHFECENIPVMIYPKECMVSIGIPYEKLYYLWIINLQYTDDYFRYLNRLLRFNKP